MNDVMNDDILSAALDGEPVDVERLRALLASPAARSTLASFVVLRAATAADRDVPVRQWTQGVSHRRRWIRESMPAAIAASVVFCALAASFWLGTHWQPRPGESAGRQPGNAQVQMSPAPSPSAAVPVGSPSVEAPPVPRRRLEFRPGTDWQPGS
jgi:negative regulator of sigma E activity